MLLAPIAGVVGAGTGSTATQTNSNSGFTEISDDVSVWDQAILPFRADTVHAETTVADLPALRIGTSDIGPTSLNRPAMSVYETGDPVTISYGADNADTSQFANEDVQILRGYLDEDDPDTGMSLSDILNSAEDLSQDDLDDLNANVTFTDESTKLDDGGELNHYENTPDDSGVYTYVMALGTDSFDVDDGDIESVNDAQIIGLEHLFAHDTPSIVDVDAGEPGDDITFDVNADELDGDVNHVITLYEADEFEQSTFTVNVTEDISTDLSAEDITIEHSIESVDGFQTISEDVTFFGETIESQRATGVTPLADIVSFLSSETGFDEPETESTGNTILSASSTATVADADTELTVETDTDWTEGDYRWVHVATGDTSDQFQANTDVINIREEEDDDEEDDDEERDPEAVISITPDPATVGEDVTFSAVDSTKGDNPIGSYDWVIDGESFSGDEVITSFDQAGTVDVELTVSNRFGEEASASTTLTVQEMADDDPATDDDPGVEDPDDDADDDGTPGFGVTVAIVSLLSIALLALRRHE